MKTALSGPVRVRFAPSPTGFLHVGGARTAIYNELLRRSLGGENILRIEDTDRQRSDEAMTAQIGSALDWLGVEYDEGPVHQSAGVERHQAAAHRLLDQGHAYRCFCTPEELEEMRKTAQAEGAALWYRGAHADLPQEEIQRCLDGGEPCALRFRMPSTPVKLVDLVRGEVEFPAGSVDDFVILRSDGSPTYHLSVVCDDVDMKVTHVLRGDDHLTNTAKHIPLFEALGTSGEYRVPAFGHLPLILGPDKKRLSKRTGATSVEEFRDQGILPAALYNYLALLGWSPGGDRELMTRNEMTELFTVERLQSSPAAFDAEKLAWINAQYMSSLELDKLMDHLEPFLVRASTEEVPLAGLAGEARKRLETAVELHRGRARTLGDLPDMVRPYFQDALEYDREMCAKFLKEPQMSAWMEALAARYGGLEDFEIDPLDSALRALAEELEVKAGVLIHPLRMALSGAKAGPPVFDLVAAMGREATVSHLGRFAAWLRSAAA